MFHYKFDISFLFMCYFINVQKNTEQYWENLRLSVTTVVSHSILLIGLTVKKDWIAQELPCMKCCFHLN